jgi:hypothetical protein
MTTVTARTQQKRSIYRSIAGVGILLFVAGCPGDTVVPPLPPPLIIAISPSSAITIEVGQTAFVFAVLSGGPTGQDRTVAYSSSSPNIATVHEFTGNVTAVSPGETLVTAFAKVDPNVRAAVLVRVPGFEPRVLIGDNQTGPVGATLAQPLVVQLVNSRGEPARVAGISVRFVAEAGGAVDPATSTTDSEGRAFTVFQLGPEAGEYTVRAELPSFPEAPPSRFTALATAPAVSVQLTPATGITVEIFQGTACPWVLPPVMLENTGQSPINWHSAVPEGIVASPTTGALQPGQKQEIQSTFPCNGNRSVTGVLGIVAHGSGGASAEASVPVSAAYYVRALRLDYPHGQFPAGAAIEETRIVGGFWAEGPECLAPGSGIMLAHRHSVEGIQIDGQGPTPDLFPGGCGHGTLTYVRVD